MICSSTVTGHLYFDTNGNGTQNAGEPNLANVSIVITDVNGAVQTVSTQVRELERALGHALLKPAGRGLVLTEAGRAALQQADHIFQIGEQLLNLAKSKTTGEFKMRAARGHGTGPRSASAGGTAAPRKAKKSDISTVLAFL